MSAEDAIADKKLRVSAPALPEGVLEALFAAICARQPTRPGICQDERIEVAAIEPIETGLTLRGTYSFDWDFASAYDRNEHHEFVAEVCDGEVRIVGWR